MAAVNPYSMPPAMADLPTIRAFLEEGVDQIMTQPLTGMSAVQYMSLYYACYNYCTTSKIHSSSESEAGPPDATNLTGSDLYYRLVRYFVQHLQDLRDRFDSIQNSEFLFKYYATEWGRYTISAKYLNHLFAYVNRHWVRAVRGHGRKGVYPIYTLALAQWRMNIFSHIQGRQSTLTVETLRRIECQRNGKTIDQSPVKIVLDSFVSIGINESNLNKVCLDYYKEHFETPFLVATEAYYKHESDSSFIKNSVSDYLKKVEGRLKEEEDYVERYLHASTRKPLLATFFRAHAEPILKIFQSLLGDDKDEDLQRMYSILCRIPEGLGLLCRIFEERMKAEGLAAVSNLVGTDSAAIEALEPKTYVNVLLEVHKNSSEFINRNFKGDSHFVACLDRACQEFVNRNAVTGTSLRRSPELLAKHADGLLRKKNKMSEGGDIEGALDRLMVIFKYLEEKDVFQTFYSTKLSKRLIHGVSASDEAESSMISRLKEACGFEYTNKLQRMFTDMSISKDLTDSFREHMEQRHNDMNINFNVMVLGTNFWPLNPIKDGFLVPADIQLTYDRFQKYYQQKYSGRKLTWLWNYSKNEWRCFYNIIATTLSLDELVTTTNVRKDILVQLLQPLVKSYILLNEDSNVYDLNPRFKSKKTRINLYQPIKAEVRAESNDVMRTVDKGRNYVIQATIIRIMKARKTMSHRSLIEEVISQTSLRFTPQVCDIKKVIDILIQKEYIERANDMWDSYVYVP